MTNFSTQGNITVGSNVTIHQNGDITSSGNLTFGNITIAANGDITTIGHVYLNGTALTAGGSSSPVVASGTLWSWGYNYDGELGQGDIVNRSSPTQVGSLNTWAHVSASGPNFAVMIKSDGTLWTMGLNNYGQLGIGTSGINVSSPVQVGSLTNWKSVSCGYNSVMAIKTDGTLWGWGRNAHGQLGQGNITNYSSPVQVGVLTNWETVSTGSESVMAVKTDGTLWACGYDNYGQLGQGTKTSYSSPVQVGSLTNWAFATSTGRFSAYAIQTNGTLWACGYNGAGQLGLGTTTNVSTFTQVGSLANWKTATSVDKTMVAIKTDGTLWTCGYNNHGQLGQGDTYGRSSPVQVGLLTNWASATGGYSITAVKTDGTLWAWGYNVYGELGSGNTISYSSPVQVGALTNWIQSACDGYGFATFAIQK